MAGLEGREAEALLDWYRAMGVDEVILEAPVNCFAAETPAPSPRGAQAQTPARAPDMRAGNAIETAASLAELEALVAAFEGCALKRTAKNLCFARGSNEARLMLIGEAPGRDEDLQGKPFVGRAGKLLDLMLAAIGLGEEHVYITNTVYWRPPGNRTPTPEEVEACAPFLRRQIVLLAPRAIVLLGGAAAKSILGTTEGIMRLRGKWLSYACADMEIPALATLHPAYLLRNPADKRLSWRDLLAVKARLESSA
jgi:DNA polymerase